MKVVVLFVLAAAIYAASIAVPAYTAVHHAQSVVSVRLAGI